MYGISIWGQAGKTIKDELLILQKRALRLIFHVKSTQSAIPLFIESNIMPLSLRFIDSVAQLMYDVTNNKARLNVSKLFTHIKEIHNYETRFSSRNNLFSRSSRLNIQKDSFSRVGVRLLNQIPTHVRKLTKSNFKKEIRSILFKSLESNDYYADIPVIFNS